MEKLCLSNFWYQNLSHYKYISLDNEIIWKNQLNWRIQNIWILYRQQRHDMEQQVANNKTNEKWRSDDSVARVFAIEGFDTENSKLFVL